MARRVNVEKEKPSVAAVLVIMCFLTYDRTNPDCFCSHTIAQNVIHLSSSQYETTCVNHVWPVGKTIDSTTPDDFDVCVVYVIG